MFNALKYIRALERVGVPRDQAEAQVEVVMDSFHENVATKLDIADLKAATKADIADLKAATNSEIADLKADIGSLRTAMAELKTDLVFRLGGIIVLCTGILGILTRF